MLIYVVVDSHGEPVYLSKDADYAYNYIRRNGGKMYNSLKNKPYYVYKGDKNESN